MPLFSCDVTHVCPPIHQKTDADQDVEAEEEEVTIPYPDLMDVMRCFEAGGVRCISF